MLTGVKSFGRSRWLVALLAGLLPWSASRAQEVGKMDEKLVQEAFAEAQQQGTWPVIARIIGGSESGQAVNLLADLTLQSYWQRRNLAWTVAFGRAGAQHALSVAAQVEVAQPARAAELRSAAKAMLYNLGSFTWPGWAEADLAISAADRAVGADAARANLWLAQQLHKPDAAQAMAHWLVGAWQLAEGRHAAARDSFGVAATFSAAAHDEPQRLLAVAYGQAAEVLAAPRDAAARQRLEATLADLRPLQEGKFLADQVATALGVFTAP